LKRIRSQKQAIVEEIKEHYSDHFVTTQEIEDHPEIQTYVHQMINSSIHVARMSSDVLRFVSGKEVDATPKAFDSLVDALTNEVPQGR